VHDLREYPDDTGRSSLPGTVSGNFYLIYEAPRTACAISGIFFTHLDGEDRLGYAACALRIGHGAVPLVGEWKMG
jgi:hypothetical protein